MNAVAGSGMASMSEASMLFQPRMVEPSKPSPSVKISSVSSRIGTGEMLPGAEGVDELDVHHLGPGLLGQFDDAFGCAHWIFVVFRRFTAVPHTKLWPDARFEKKMPVTGGRPCCQSKSDCLLARLFGADADGVLNRADEHFAVADLAGLRRL